MIQAMRRHPSDRCCQRCRNLWHTWALTWRATVAKSKRERGLTDFILLVLPSGLQTKPLSLPDRHRKRQMEIPALGPSFCVMQSISIAEWSTWSDLLCQRWIHSWGCANVSEEAHVMLKYSTILWEIWIKREKASSNLDCDVWMTCLPPHLSVSVTSLSAMTLQSKQTCSVEKETSFRSRGPSSSNLCRDIISFAEPQDQVCRSTLSNSWRVCVCVCVFVCVLGSIIRTGCLAPYVRSVRGSWENKVLRGPLCYCYLPPPRVVFEDRKYESDRSPRGMWQWFILWWPLTYPLHPRPLSHTTPLALKHSPLSPGPKIKRPDRAQPGSARPNPAQHNRPCVLRFVLASNEKQMDSEERTQKRRRERKRKKGSLVKYLRRKITQGGCLIISICLVWFCWGGHVVSLAAPWFIFHIIWSWMESKKEEGGFQGSVGRVGCLGSQWEGCGEVEGGLVSWSEMR